MIVKFLRSWFKLIVLVMVLLAGAGLAFDWYGWAPPQETREHTITP